MAQFDVYSTSVENIISWIKSRDRLFGRRESAQSHEFAFNTE